MKKLLILLFFFALLPCFSTLYTINANSFDNATLNLTAGDAILLTNGNITKLFQVIYQQINLNKTINYSEVYFDANRNLTIIGPIFPIFDEIASLGNGGIWRKYGIVVTCANITSEVCPDVTCPACPACPDVTCKDLNYTQGQIDNYLAELEDFKKGKDNNTLQLVEKQTELKNAQDNYNRTLITNDKEMRNNQIFSLAIACLSASLLVLIATIIFPRFFGQTPTVRTREGPLNKKSSEKLIGTEIAKELNEVKKEVNENGNI